MLKYPFTSKYKYFEYNDLEKEPYVHDYRLKTCKQYMKPNFSNEPYCYEADLMFVKNTIYFVLINVNTRYLIVEQIKDRRLSTLSYTLANILVKYDIEIKTIKSDGERGFIKLANDIIELTLNDDSILYVPNLHERVKESSIRSKDKVLDKIINQHDTKLLKQIINDIDFDSVLRESSQLYVKEWRIYKIKFVVNSSKFALAHKTIDSVIRTLRNAFGLNETKLANIEYMRQMVNYYNKTPHKSLRLRNYNYDFDDTDESEVILNKNKYIYYSPIQFQNDIDLEWKYIRLMRSKLQEIKNKQKLKGLLKYKKGNILLVHTDFAKTKQKFAKRRRVFNEIAEFLTYINGNCVCDLLRYNMKPIEIPIAFTKKVADNYDELDKDIKLYFDI